MPSRSDSEAPKTWRLIVDPPAAAAWNMAVDEAISLSVRRDAAPPTLRLYEWQKPAITIGSFQKIAEEVEIERCRDRGIDVVRRITGGRAILHVPEELTYSFSTPFIDPFTRGLHDSYMRISGAFLAGFRLLGLEASMNSGRATIGQGGRGGHNPVCFQALSYAEASIEGRKIIGSAQKRWTDGLLQQGSIPLVIPYQTLFEVLRFPSSELREYAMAEAHKKMTGLRDYLPGLTIRELTDAVTKGFNECFGVAWKLCVLSKKEWDLAKELGTSRYGSDAWNTRK